MQTLTIIRPDDFHLHVRSGDALKSVVPFTARQMGRALIMPNLKPPVCTVAQALAYREEPYAKPKQPALPPSSSIRPAPPPIPTAA